MNDQVFRGFFTGRYIFDSVTGFLRYASPAAAGGFGPQTVACSNGTFVTAPTACPAGTTTTGGPLLFFLQDGIPSGVTGVPAPGASNIKNEDYALFAQDKWQIRPNLTLNYGSRWEAQIFPKPVIPPSQTAYGIFLSDPRFPSDGTLHSQKSEFQPRVGFAWDIGSRGKSVLRANYGIFYARQNMLSQVGSITTNGAQQRTNFVNTDLIRQFGVPAPVWPNVQPGSFAPCPPNPFPCFTGVRVFSKNYANPRIYTANAAFEQELVKDLSIYFDFTHSKGVHLTRFLNFGRTGFFSPQLSDVFVASSVGKSLYNGFTVGMRKRFSKRYQFELNYVLSKDKDDDSNERDPFTDRALDLNNLQLDYALSDRDIRHKFNFYMYSQLPWGFEFVPRVQARSAQPANPGAFVPPPCANRNTLRKDNEYVSFDWRLSRPFKIGEGLALTPTVEMFNTFNTDNRINALSTCGNQNSLTAPSLFDFNGFLRQGVGDPRQVQLAIRFTF